MFLSIIRRIACVVLSTKSSCFRLPLPVKLQSWCSKSSVHVRALPGNLSLSGSQT